MAETMDIEALLVWAYQRHQVHSTQGEGWGGPVMRTAAQAMMVVVELGCRVDGGGVRPLPGLPARAEAVGAAVAALPSRVAGLVALHARLGTQPRWDYEVRAVLRPVRGPGGRTHRKEVHGGEVVMVCPLAMDWDVDFVTYGRAQYRLWWDALAALADRLGVSGPAAPREPWLMAPCKFELASA